jgi:hypothetical protein
VLVNPIMFGSLKSRTYFLFAGLNLLWIPIVFLFYPETADRSLESIEAMFSPKSPFYKKMEEAYKKSGDVLHERGYSLSKPPENVRYLTIAGQFTADEKHENSSDALSALHAEAV